MGMHVRDRRTIRRVRHDRQLPIKLYRLTGVADTSTQGEYTKSKRALESIKDFNGPKRQSQILPFDHSSLSYSSKLLVVHAGGITQYAGDRISFGIIGISEIARSLP